MKPADQAEVSDAGKAATATERLGLKLSESQLASLTCYRDLLIDANTRLNLTALKSAPEIDSRLIAESLAIVPLLNSRDEQVLDIGTGGGIPGIPLAIACPSCTVHLLDSTGKKLDTLRGMVSQLEITNVDFIHGRAEEIGHQPQFRGCYTLVVARAVARLSTLVEYTLPFLQPGGVAILPKGQSVYDELREAETAITTLGGSLIDVYESSVNSARFVRIEQMSASPAEYPRRPGIPARQPIGVSTR